MSPRSHPISERYRLAAKHWAELDGAARLLEESKTTVLAQRMAALGDIPASHAERDVKASPAWQEYITQMVDARTAANVARVEVDYLRMLFSEWQSAAADERSERRM